MFNTLTLLPSDPIYGMQALYKADNRDNRINLSIGICLDEKGKLLKFKAVEEAEKRLFQIAPSKEYLSITGLQAYNDMAQKLIVGPQQSDDIASVQTVGGTGALYLVGQLLKKAQISEVYIPEPSWPNHKQLFSQAGLNVHSYPYYNAATISLEFDKMVQAISRMPPKSALILQASCHNPTGIDPTKSEWEELSALIKEKGILPIFDLAYMGLGDGIHEDTAGIRQFLQDGHELFICSTFAKSMGLYNDRLGLLTIKHKKSHLDTILSHIRSIARTAYSSPPAHGAFIAREILSDAKLQDEWLTELEATRNRLFAQRSMLYNALKEANCKIPYSHIMQTKGLFCLFDIAPKDVVQLREQHGIYIALDGRISLAAITKENVTAIAKGMSEL